MDTRYLGKVAVTAFVQHGSFAIALALLCAGCKLASIDRSAGRRDVDAIASDQTDGRAADPEGALPPELAALRSSAWTEVPQPPFSRRDDKILRWRHSNIEPLAHRPPTDRPDVSGALSSSQPVIAANAAILMARWATGQPTQKLVETIRDRELPLGLRCAAAEALGRVLQPSPGEALRDLLQQFIADKSERLAESSDLHADLLRALARHAEPGDEKWFTTALHSPAWQVRYEALCAWAAVGPNQNLPPAAIDLRSDRDPRIRAAALGAIAAHRDPHAIEFLQEGLGDRTFDVHLAAIAALGELGSDKARALLDQLKGHRFELSRAATVGALAAAGMHEEVEAAAKDASSQVRLAVAQTLAQATQKDRQVAAQTIVAAQNLARDSSADVQQQAIESLAAWPLEQAGPVLLLAIGEGGYRARKTAAAQLSARWRPAADFPVDEGAERRTTALAELKRLWTEKFGSIDDAAELYDEALPGTSPVLARLQRLSSNDASERRAAAAEMAVETATAALPALALNRLTEVVEAEKDPLVWRGILAAIAGDSRDAAVHIVYEAIASPSVEVRRAACEYLGAHGDPRHGQILLGVLQDPDPSVVSAAVRALGAAHVLDDPEPLVRMLDSPDKQLQLEAALSLSRLHVPPGAKVVERMASDADLEIRLRAAKAMGEVADQMFLPVLVTMLTDQATVQPAVLTSMAQIACHDVVAPEDGSSVSNEEKVRRWQLWYRDREDPDADKQ